MADARIDALRSIPLFASLSARSLGRVAEATKEVEVAAGHVLVQPGTKGTGMFFIADGTAVVETRRRKRELGPGDFFGELALMREDATRTARGASFRKLTAEHPEVAASLLEIALARLAENAGVPTRA